MSAADKIAEAKGPERIWAHGNCMGRLGRPLVPGVSSHWATWETRAGDPNHATEYVRADLAEAQAQENAKLKAENERLNKMLQPEWFYPFDGCDGESTYDSVHDLLDEHYFWDRPKTGQHVVKVEAVTTLPSIWAAVRFNCTCADPEDCECDNDMIVTEHASEAEARAALGDAP